MSGIQPGPILQVGVINNKCGINDLSDEILLQIFSYVSPALLLTTLPNVCLRWKTLCSDFSLYRRLVFSRDDPDTSMAVAMIRGAPWLRSLELVKRRDVNAILCHLGECCPLLEKLVVMNSRYGSSGRRVSSGHLRQIITCCTKLRSLLLVYTSVTDHSVLMDIGPKLTSLTSINFGFSFENVNPNDALMSIANHCVGMEEIQIHANDNIEEKVVRKLCEKFCKSLKILVLKFISEWSDAAIESLTKCHKLEDLFLWNMNGKITEDGLKLIGLMPNIKKLELARFDSISSEAWMELVASPMMRNLKEVVIGDCSNVVNNVVTAINELPNIAKFETYISC